MLPLVENVVRKYFKRIRFVDVTPELLQPSFEQWRTALEKPFLSQYGVLFLCHTGGIIIPEIEELIDYAKKKDMFIIEDFSHAHGCTMNGRLAGTYGDISIASMYVTKVLMCGEGGIILVDDEKLERKIQEFVNAGKSRRTEKVKRTGFNFRMSEMNACIGIVDMLHRDEIYAQRKAMADRYVVVPLQEKVPGLQSTYYRFTVLLPKEVDVPLETVSKTFDVNANHALPGTRETVALHRNLALYRGCPPEVIDKNNEVLEQLVQKSILEGRVCRR
jgi:dTDP-4-amino-4,6-dideoxygalactose transaminase